MWIRDALPKELPNLRVALYGYDTSLPDSNSFQTISDLASSLINSLKASGLASWTMKPLLFLAHSLGGIVFKEALVALANNGDPERHILHQMVGGLFFGVPSRGMDTQALITMTNGRPNENLLQNLTVGSEYLRDLDNRASGIMASKGMSLFWAYETRMSPTVVVRAIFLRYQVRTDLYRNNLMGSLQEPGLKRFL